MEEITKLFQISCKNCGAPVGFDIPGQTYRCVNCGTQANSREVSAIWKLSDGEDSIRIRPTSISCSSCGAAAELDQAADVYRCAWCGTETEAPKRQELPWKALNARAWETVELQEEITECTSCGARVLFRKDEVSETCAFCGGNLVRNALREAEELPEFIIPFVLTENEARERLAEWVKSQKDNKDTRRVKGNLKFLKGYYLPYRMIRGPLEGIAYRDQMSKKYKYKGFLDHAVVNASGQMDNAVLDAAEPFDLTALQLFEPGYIGGHRVKLGDAAPDVIEQRTMEEAMEGYRPYVAKVLQNDDVKMQVTSGEFMHLPILLPVYVLQVGKYLAVVNGQTGKVAVASGEKPKESKRWLIEPTVLTVLAALTGGAFFKFWIGAIAIFGLIAGLVFFTAYGQDRNSVKHRRIYRGKSSQAHREKGELKLTEEGDILKNALPNDPAFYDSDGRREAQVEPKFYTVGRIFKLALEMSVTILLPIILAVLINRGFDGLVLRNGAAWYVTTGGIVIIYWIRGVRWDVYNHPILYEVLPDGNRKLFGSRKSRRLSMLSLFGLDSMENLRDMGGLAIFIVCFIAFLLIGSTIAMII